MVVISHIDHAAGHEIRIQFKSFTPQVFYRGFDELTKIVWQDLGRETDCNTVRPLCKQERKLHRKGNRLILSSIITQLPFGGLVVECDLQCKLAETSLDVSRCRGIITGT